MNGPAAHRPLTDAGYTTLARAQHAPLCCRDDGQWPAKPATLRALLRRGLLHSTPVDDHGPTWTITPQGRTALRQAPPRLLHRQSERGYTANAAQAMAGEPEAVEPVYLQAFAATARLNDVAARHQRHTQPIAPRLAAVEPIASRRQRAQLNALISSIERSSRRA